MKNHFRKIVTNLQLIKNLKNKELANKDIIGFVGSWTLLVYMINKASKNGLNKEFFDDKKLIKDILEVWINL